MPERAPEGTRPLASCREHLREIDARLDALADACTQRCDRLLAALERLPEAARFEPFPAAASAETPVQAGTPQGRPRQTARSPAGETPRPAARPTVRPQARPGKNPFAGIAEALEAASQPGARAALLAKTALQSLASGAPAVDPAALAALPQAAGLLVAELLARVPAPTVPNSPRPAPGIGSQLGDQPAEAQFSRMLGKLVAQGTGRPAAEQSAPARQAKRPPQELGKAMATAMAELLASHPEIATPPAIQSNLANALAGQTSGMLAQLLGGIDADATPPAARRSAANAPPRSPAPRAQARLMEDSAQNTPPGAGRGQKAAPASDPQPAEEGGELARQLNRLLLDQAWLRGVDLT